MAWYNISMDTKLCISCEEEFTPTSRHRKCPKCRGRSVDNYDNCQCGKRKQKKSSKCYLCSSKRFGEENPNWKGGKFIKKNGYVLVGLPGNCYVFEHRLVMEEFLKRPLKSNENVHHKNGNRSDNSIQNLELWTTNQPSGQRVEDLILYAKSILDLYGDDPSKYGFKD